MILLLIFSIIFLSLDGADSSKEELIKKYKLEKYPANIAHMSESFKATLGLSSTTAAELFKEKLNVLYETSQELQTESDAQSPKFGLNKKQLGVIRARAEQLDDETKEKAQRLKPFLSKKEIEARSQRRWRNAERACWCAVGFTAWLVGYYFGYQHGCAQED